MLYQHNMGAGGWIFMAAGIIIIGGLIIAFVLLFIKDLHARSHRDGIAAGASVREILDRRLATAEINPEEYERLRATLAPGPGDPAPRDGQHRRRSRLTRLRRERRPARCADVHPPSAGSAH